jgi:hypothetical protein
MNRLTTHLLLLLFLLPLVNACENSISSLTGESSSNSTNNNGSKLPAAKFKAIPDSDKLDDNCSTNSAYDTCIFYADPVTQTKSALTSNDLNNDLISRLKFGVKLTDISTGSALLKNDWLTIENNGTNIQVSAINTQLTDLNQIAEVMSYYWTNLTIKYWENMTSINYFKANPLTIHTNDKLFGVSKLKNSIHVMTNSTGFNSAHDAGVLIHLVGQVLVNVATEGKTKVDATHAKHKTCAEGGLCCVDNKGCVQAIKQGVGDFLSYSVFGKDYQIASGLKNDTTGSVRCNVSRSVSQLKSLSLNEAYSACENQNDSAGSTITLGSLYASIWWEVRTKIESEYGGLERENFDKLFMAHLSLIDADDDFSTVFQKVKALDDSNHQSKWFKIIKQEVEARGITL